MLLVVKIFVIWRVEKGTICLLTVLTTTLFFPNTLPSHPPPTHPTRPHHPLKKIKNFFHTLKKKIQKKFKLFLIQQKKLWCPATLFDYTLDIAIFCV
jgi:hypothetical protein